MTRRAQVEYDHLVSQGFTPRRTAAGAELYSPKGRLLLAVDDHGRAVYVAASWDEATVRNVGHVLLLASEVDTPVAWGDAEAPKAPPPANLFVS